MPSEKTGKNARFSCSPALTNQDVNEMQPFEVDAEEAGMLLPGKSPPSKGEHALFGDGIVSRHKACHCRAPIVMCTTVGLRCAARCSLIISRSRTLVMVRVRL